MKTELLKLLHCPKTGQSLKLEGAHKSGLEIEAGWLISADGQYHYPIRNGIPRFVPESNYAENFGMQWNHFAKTQLDSYSGLPISADRFWKATNWVAKDMKGCWVLDVGCGSGRFAEIALNTGAKVVALDYSTAVDACYTNLHHHPNLHVVQGDIFSLPFARSTFSYVYSLGVLQHTPDVAGAFTALPPLLKEGGKLCVDYYEKSLKRVLLPKYWLRPFTKRMDKHRLFTLLEETVPVLLQISHVFSCIPVVGRWMRRTVPVADYRGILPLTETQVHEWALLDTFDWLSPAYDNPQTAATARLWMEQAGLKEIEILRVGHLVARGCKASKSTCANTIST